MFYSAEINIKDPDKGLAGYLSSMEDIRGRSEIRIQEKGGVVLIEVKAKDATAFRAAISTVTQSLSVFETVKQNG